MSVKGVGEENPKALCPGIPDCERLGLEGGLPKLSVMGKGSSAKLKTLNGCGAVDGRSNDSDCCTEGWVVKLCPRTEGGDWGCLGLGKLKISTG